MVQKEEKDKRESMQKIKERMKWQDGQIRKQSYHSTHIPSCPPISNSELPYQKSMDTDRCTAFSWRESRWLVVGTSSRSSSRSQLSAASCE